VKSKKIPAPRRAGTATKSARTSRAAREAAVVENLERLRVRDRASFLEMMRLLARLCAIARAT
jgi:hypothetical protein